MNPSDPSDPLRQASRYNATYVAPPVIYIGGGLLVLAGVYFQVAAGKQGWVVALIGLACILGQICLSLLRRRGRISG